MKSAMIMAALSAVLCVSAPLSAQAATTAMTPAKGMSDVAIYCSFFPWTAKCAATAPAKALAHARTVAMVKPVAKPVAMTVPMAKPARLSVKTMACVKAEPGKGYLYSCSWK